MSLHKLSKIANKFLDDNRVSKQEYVSLASQRKATGVIGSGGNSMYALYDHNDTLLYIGWAGYLSIRLGAHFSSYTNTNHFKHRIAYAKYTHRLDELRGRYNKIIQLKHPDTEVFDLEYFTIKLLDPQYNKVRAEDRLLKSIYEEAY
jgi:hypothetical protein